MKSQSSAKHLQLPLSKTSTPASNAAHPTRRRGIPLKLVLVLPFVLQACGAALVIGYIAFRNERQAVRNLVEQVAVQVSERVDTQLSEYLSTPMRLVQINAGAIANGEIRLDDPAASGRYFWRQARAFPTIAYTGFVRPDGSEIGARRLAQGLDVLLYENRPQKPGTYHGTYHTVDLQGNRATQLRQEQVNPLHTHDWYQEAFAAGKPIWSEIEVLQRLSIRRSETNLVLKPQSNVQNGESVYFLATSANASVYNANREFLGFIHIDVDLTGISDFLRNIRVSPSGQIFLMERSGLLVGSSSQPPILSNGDQALQRFNSFNSPDPKIRAISEAIQTEFGNLYAIQSATQIEAAYKQQRQFVYIKPWRDAYGLDWLMVIVLPKADFMAEIDAETQRNILLCAVVLLISLAMGLLTSHWIARPIDRLSQASQRMAEGDLSHQVEATSQIQEFTALGESFNHMATQIASLFANLEHANAELERINSELESRVEERTAALRQTLTELEQTQAQMVQSEKMSSLGQLVAGIAHEINNPVNFIHGNLSPLKESVSDLLHLIQLYQRHCPVPPREVQDTADAIDLEFLQQDLPKLLNSLRSGTDRIRQIVLSLRNFARMDEAEFKAVDIHEGIDSTLLILEHRLKAKGNRPDIQVIKRYADLPEVECYPGPLNQVLMNILANAIDALEAKDADRTKEAILQDPSKIEISTALVDSEWVEIAIADNGGGIPQEIQRQIFDPFFTTKPVGKGTGMGLSISYQIIVEKHRGTLECFSTPEEGTRFVVRIPRVQQTPETSEAKEGLQMELAAG
ncbi:MAG: ATP-binding protein [Cyanobacteriota bacterium]